MGTDSEWSDFPHDYRFRGYCIPYCKERVHSKTVEEAVLKTARKIKGAYGLVVMSPEN